MTIRNACRIDFTGVAKHYRPLPINTGGAMWLCCVVAMLVPTVAGMPRTLHWHRLVPDNAPEIAVTIVGAAIALAGLLLVFAGLASSQAATFPPESAAYTKRYRTAGRIGVVPFVVALADAAAGMAWLVGSPSWYYTAAVDGFFFLIAVTAVYGGWLLLVYL